MKILITGSSGFLGKTLCNYLELLGHDLTKLNSRNCDLCNPRGLEVYSSLSFEMIFHLAAWTQAGDFCLRHPGEQWIINQKINTNVLDWWANSQPQAKLIFMGTSCAYSPESGLTEEEYMVGEPISSLYTYAMTKRMLYQGARALNQQYGLRYICAVPSTLYGSDYHRDGRQMHFIFDLIRKIIRGKEYDEPVVLWGDGKQMRELVLVDDFVDLMWQVSCKFENDIFNIGAGKEHTIRHFASVICDRVGYSSGLINYDTNRYVGAKSKCLNIDKINRALPQYELKSLDFGISKTIEWFYQTRAYGEKLAD